MRLEDGAEAIVILVRDGIVLVIVTLGAVERETNECLAGMLDGGVEPGGAVEEIIIAREKTRGAQGIRISRRQFIRGEHFLNHPVKPLVVVEGFDDPIAPMPNVFLAVAQLRAEAVPIGVAPDIHPVPRPAFAVMRALEQFIDNHLPRPRVHQLLTRGWKPDEIEVQTAQQDRPFRRWLRLEPTRLPATLQQHINHIASIVRQRHAFGHLKRPVISWIRLGKFIRRHRCAGSDPFPNGRNLRWLQGRAFRRHAFLRVMGRQPRQQFTLRRLTEHHHGLALRALADVRRRIHAQPGLLLERPVTRITPRLQDRLDVVQIIGGQSGHTEAGHARNE